MRFKVIWWIERGITRLAGLLEGVLITIEQPGKVRFMLIESSGCKLMESRKPFFFGLRTGSVKSNCILCISLFQSS